MRPWNFNMDFTKFMNKFNEIEKQLSPTSSLRLSFDNISPESDEPPDINKKLFGVPVPPFVSDKVVSWIEEGLNEPPIFYNGLNVMKKLISSCGLSLRPHCTNLSFLSRACSISEETYDNAINALNTLQSNAVTIKKSLINTNAQSKNLSETAKYLNRIGITLNKLDQLSVIHVSGTKGKGSTCSLTESILRSFNIRTGFFSSPHLVSVTERIRINGVPISREEFTKNFWFVYNNLKSQQDYENDMPAYFKFLTILSFHIFIESAVDVAILEVGIGGENDCTNVVRNTKTVGITALGLEHTNLLGNTIEEIAWQKAGIIKKNSNCFTVPQQPSEALEILKQRAKENNAKLNIVPYFNEYNWYRIPKLNVNHEAQFSNISLAIQLAYDWLRQNKLQNLNGFYEKIFHNILPLDIPKKVVKGLENSFWPGRWQFLNLNNFKIYLDGAHTIESIQICTDWFKKSTHDSKNIKLLIFNATGDRDAEKLLYSLNSDISFYKAYFTPNIPYEKGIRDTKDSKSIIATSEQILKCQGHMKIWNSLNEKNKGDYFSSIENALKQIDNEFARNVNVDILITGSIHLIGATILALEQFEKSRINVENVRMIDRYNTKNPTIGTLYITATHLIFVEPESNKETWILHMHIASVDKLALSTTGSPLLIRCKTFLSVNFVIPKDSECHDVYTSLLKLFQPVSINKLYAFSYSPGKEDFPKSAGWDFFKLENEFKRMKVPNDQWSLCNLNQNYELCDTYPRQIYVPAEASTAMLIGSSRFRSKGRLPALTYLHSNKATICRCSQPLSGFSARCLEDEQMLEAIRKTNPNVDYMYVVDTRPRINAMANRAAGKGYENEAFYENIKFQFLGIENIHVQRTSLQKLIETCEQKSPTMSGFLSSLESSGWLKHIRSILDTSSFIANAVDKGVSVVVHCSDGWDRTAQVCSLASLMLDPYYRTIKGFQALIEKDWLAFGHKFSERCGHIQTDPKEISPVFTQFLDCTWQLMIQRNDAFEFNERFLLILHDHVMSCQFGTFIGNCEKDRLDLKLSERTYSLWGYMANYMNEYVNPLYRPEMDEILKANLAPQCIRFWRGMYSRFESGVHPREPLGDLLLASKDHCNSLEDHVTHLSKRIASFKNYISKSAKKLSDATRTTSKECTNAEINDNKYNYDNKKMSELSSADDDHPLKSAEMSFSNLSMSEVDPNRLAEEIDSVAVEWKSLRNVTTCPCSTPFDQFNKKNHCWKCGEVFCSRCIDKSISLPGHDSGKPVPVCRSCFRLVKKISP